MDPTALPTDNLYKFMAMGSMFGIGFVAYWARKNIYEVAPKQVSAERRGDTDAAKFYKESLDEQMTRLAIVAVVLVCAMVVGFVLWYTKYQRYQDEATQYALREQKAKAELAEIELQRARQKND